MKRPFRGFAFWAVLLALTFSFVALRSRAMLPLGWDIDEGSFVVSAFWVSQGAHLYSQIGVRVYPLLPELLGLVFRAFGPDLSLARHVVLAFAGLYLIVVGLTGRRLRGAACGLAAVSGLALSGLLFELSGLVLADLPPLALGGVSVLLGFKYLRASNDGRRIAYLAVAGLAYGLSMILKPMFPLLALWLVAVIAVARLSGGFEAARRDWRRTVRDLALAVITAAIPVAVTVLVYDPGALIRFTVTSVLESNRLEQWDPQRRLDLYVDFVRSYWGVILLALISPLVVDRRDRRDMVYTALLWLLLGLALLPIVLQARLFSRHLVALTLPLSLLAGLAVTGLLRNSFKAGSAWLRYGSRLVLAAAVVFAVTTVWWNVQWYGRGARYDQGGPEVAGLALLSRITSPGEVIASDDPTLAFVGQRSVPPWLSDVSHARNHSGLLTEAEAISELEKYDVQTVCVWANRFADLPGFIRWTDSHFAGDTPIGPGKQVLHGRRYEEGEVIPGFISLPNMVLDGTIALIGYRLDPPEDRCTRDRRLILYWKSLAPVAKDYQVFVHMAQPDSAPIFQADGPALNGLYPTSRWHPGEILADVHVLRLPANIAANEPYQLLTGMYDLETNNRLPVSANPAAYPNAAIRVTALAACS